MKLFKPILKINFIKTILLCIAMICSTSVIAHYNCGQSNAYFKLLDTVQTVHCYQSDPSKTLNQEMLLNLSKGNEISSIFNTLTEEELSDKKSINVVYKSDYLTLKLDGKLICVSDKGIFVYSKNTLTYIPYTFIKFIKFIFI